MFKNWFKKSSYNTHHLNPQRTPLSPEDEALVSDKLKEIMASQYSRYISSLRDKVVGKTVVQTTTGNSGFILSFSDTSWVIVYLEGMQLRWQYGKGSNFKTFEKYINSPEYGNGYDPIPINRMYANEICDIKVEIAHANGKEIKGLSIGANCFNFCFPDGMELDTSIVPTSEGMYALRVFWERW
jgi:hypothetical protein